MFPFHLSEQQADNAGWDFELYLQDALGLLMNSKHIYIYVFFFFFFAMATFLKCRVAASGKEVQGCNMQYWCKNFTLKHSQMTQAGRSASMEALNGHGFPKISKSITLLSSGSHVSF